MSSSTHSFVVGSTNNLLLSQKDRYADFLINLDEETASAKVQILDPALRNALSLSAADRRWIDNVAQTVTDTWDPVNPNRPNTHGYSGSEDAIRLQFEEYLLSLCSSAAYKTYYDTNPPPDDSRGSISEDRQYNDPLETANDFNAEFMTIWRQTPNFALFDRLTRNAAIFDVIAPKHPTAGSLNIEDVQRRLAQGVAELHLDDRVREGKETVGRVFGEGRERVGAGVARLWKEVGDFRERREASRNRDEKLRVSTDPTQLRDNISGSTTTPTGHVGVTSDNSPNSSSPTTQGASASGWLGNVRDRASRVQIQRPDMSGARDNAAKAGAYLSSWGSWARDRGREWSEKRTQSTDRGSVSSQASGGGGGRSNETSIRPSGEGVDRYTVSDGKE